MKSAKSRYSKFKIFCEKVAIIPISKLELFSNLSNENSTFHGFSKYALVSTSRKNIVIFIQIPRHNSTVECRIFVSFIWDWSQLWLLNSKLEYLDFAKGKVHLDSTEDHYPIRNTLPYLFVKLIKWVVFPDIGKWPLQYIEKKKTLQRIFNFPFFSFPQVSKFSKGKIIKNDLWNTSGFLTGCTSK